MNTLSETTAFLTDGLELLDQAIDYALVTAEGVTPAALSRPTPCQDWDLHALLWHVNESLAALLVGLETGQMGLEPSTPDDYAGAADVQAVFRERARLLQSACARVPGGRIVFIADMPLTAYMVAATGALEVAVHGWDIGQACGHGLPIPASLAVSLMAIRRLLVNDAERYGQFAPAAPAPRSADPSDQLTAFLGRQNWPK